MTSMKRTVANYLERVTKARIVSPHRVSFLYEEEHIRRIFDTFDIDCVFDIGANAGQYASMLRERVGYHGAIISFEPIPSLARKLSDAAKHDKNWFIRELALNDTAGAVRFKITTDSQFSSVRNPNSVSHDLFAGAVKIENEIEIQTATLKSEFEFWREKIGFSRPYLKMDTQGNDLAIAKGGQEVLHKFIAIQTETSIVKLYDEIPSLSESIDFFHNEGFQLSAFVPNNEGMFPILLETDCIFINRAQARATGQKSA